MAHKNIFTIVVGTLVLMGVTLGVRLYDLGATSFVADEFLDMNGSMGYAKTGVWQSWDFNYGVPATQNLNEARDERATVYKWQVAQVLRITEPIEQNARLVSVLWGVVSLLAIMLVTFLITGRIATAFLAGALFSVAVSAVVFDRRLRMYSMFYPLYLLSSFFFFATLERVYQGKNRLLQFVQKTFRYHPGYGVLFVFFLGLSFLTHQLTGTLFFTAFVYALVSAVLVWHTQKSLQNVYTQTLALMIALLVGLFVFAKPFVMSFVAGLVWLDNHYGYWAHFWSDFEHPLLGLVVVLLGGYTLWYNQNKKQESLFLMLSAFVPLVLAIWFWRRNVGPQYIFMAQSFLLVLAAAGSMAFVRVLKTVLPGKRQRFAQCSVLFLAVLLLPNYSYFFADENAYRQPASGENTNYRKLFTVFTQERQGFDVLVTRNFRNYYFAGANIPVYDFGGELSEQKLQKSELETLRKQYAHGAVVFSKNDLDYVSQAAESYLESDAFTKISSPTIRGGNVMYRW